MGADAATVVSLRNVQIEGIGAPMACPPAAP